MTVCNRYIKVSRLKGDGKLEELLLVPGQEVPDWAVKEIDPAHLGDPRDPLEEQDQFLQSLRDTATREGIEFDETWKKEHLSAAITAVRQAAAGGHRIDASQFGPASTSASSEGDSGAQSGSGDELKSLDRMSRDELNEEHKQRFNELPHHALSDDNLRKRLSEAREGK